MVGPRDSDRPIDVEPATVTEEVGSEGGSPGDVEIAVDWEPLRGSEADTTVRPVSGVRKRRVYVEARRSP
jgi:hypothetical protein